MDNIKVGHLVPIVIIEDLKDQDSFLTSILGKGMKAILPKKYAIRDYKVGEYSSASIYSIDKGGVFFLRGLLYITERLWNIFFILSFRVAESR